jgi:hypothetical protein
MEIGAISGEAQVLNLMQNSGSTEESTESPAAKAAEALQRQGSPVEQQKRTDDALRAAAMGGTFSATA